MRFYQIKISKGGALWVPPSMAALNDREASYTSWHNGKHLTSALNVTWNIPMAPEHQPRGATLIRIFGIGLQDISQVNNLLDYDISIRAGMKNPGLPLGVPKTPDLLITGTIQKCFGNWVGNLTELDLVVIPSGGGDGNGSGGSAQPAITPEDLTRNLTLDWQDGQSLAEALQKTLTAGFPNAKIDIQISDQLKVKGQHTGYYPTLPQLAIAIKQFTSDTQFRGIKRPDGTPYQGVDLARDPDGKTIRARDGTATGTTATTKKIDFIDLIGQPTWVEINKVQMQTVLRGDLNLFDRVSLPAALRTPYVRTTERGAGQMGSLAESANPMIFQGEFEIAAMNHFANFRQPGGTDWVTTFDMLTTGPNGGEATAPDSPATTEPKKPGPETPLGAGVDNT
jgi:hypothetical protein